MQCPYCNGDSQVVDSRTASEGVRRRRTCNACKRRFTTYERLAAPNIKVQKRDRSSQPFDSAKLERVLGRVGRDRPGLGAADAQRIARTIEAQLLDAGVKSIRSSEILERLLALLRDIDTLAHDRLAANYIDENGHFRSEPDVQATSTDGQLGLFSSGLSPSGEEEPS